MKGPPAWMLFVFGFLCNGYGALILWEQGNQWCLASAFLTGIAFLALLYRYPTAVRTADKD